MTYRGTVRAGVIVLELGAEVAEGADVMVEVLKVPGSLTSAQPDPVFSMYELAIDTGISDLATNVDHYRYGHPKVDDRR